MAKFNVEHTVYRSESIEVTVEADSEQEARDIVEIYLSEEWPDYTPGKLADEDGEWCIREVADSTKLSDLT